MNIYKKTIVLALFPLIGTALFFLKEQPSSNLPVTNISIGSEELSNSQSPSDASTQAKTPAPANCGCAKCTKNTAKTFSSPPAPKPVNNEVIVITGELKEYLFSLKNKAAVTIPLPKGGQALGSIDLIQEQEDKTVFIQGRITTPQSGFFFFRDQSNQPGVAGNIVGLIRFDNSDIAYRVEPLGKNGASVLVERTKNEVMCQNFTPLEHDPLAAAERILANHPTNIDTTASQNDVPPLESLPGSSAVVYLDFDGEEGPHESWGDFDAAPWGGDRQQRINIWKRVAEDFAPFNINVTTDLQVYLAAPETSRQRCIITPTTNAQPGAGGVAFFNSFNWAGDVPCWSFNGGENNAAMTISHEIGHTLGLGHDGRTLPPDSTHEEYYGGHGSGTVAWGSIMGAPFGKNLTQWSKGEYLYANRQQDDISHIITQNNVTAFRTDDHSDSLSSATHLDIFSDNSVLGEGVIEQETDLDGFKFTLSASGSISLTASPEAIGPNLDIFFEIIDSSSSVVASNNPDTDLNASISTTLPAGEYMVRVSGTGRGDVLGDGYSSYGSLGFYKISGTITNALIQQRFSIAENSSNSTIIGSVAPNNNHGSDSISYNINSGNDASALALDSSTGQLTVADSSILDYETLSTSFDDPAEFRLSIDITNSTTPSLNETVQVVVAVTDVNEPHTVSGPSHAQLYRLATVNTIVAAFEVQSVDRYPAPTDWTISSGNTNNAFGIDSSGRIFVADPSAIGSLTSFNLQITGTDNGPPSPVMSASQSINIDILDWDPVDGAVALTGRNWTQEAGVTASQSSTSEAYGSGVNDANIAIDGNTSGNWTLDQTTHTDDQSNSWWQVDLGTEREIESIELYNRTDCCQIRLSNFRISVRDSGGTEVIGQDFYTTAESVGNNEKWTLPSIVNGQFVRIEIQGLNNDGNGVLSLAEVIVSSPAPKNIAGMTNWARELGTSASQSSTFESNDASRAIDGNTGGNFNEGQVTHTEDLQNSWWEVDLAQIRPIDRVVLYNRTDCCGDRLSNYRITVLDESRSEIAGQDFHTGFSVSGATESWSLPSTVNGRYVRVALKGSNSGSSGNGVLSLAEVEVYGNDPSAILPVAQQSTTFNERDASIAIDGVIAGDYSISQVTHTDGNSANWWEVDLGQTAQLEQIAIYNRTDCCQNRLSNFRVSIWNGSTEVYGSDHFTDGSSHAGDQFTITSIGDMVADRIRIESLGTNADGNRVISLAEVKVFGLRANQPPAIADSSFNIDENVSIGAAVGTVTATDANTGDIITYALTAGNTGGAFAIDNSGSITTAAALDYETLNSYSLQVTASDNASPQLSDTATITINISNITLDDDSDNDGLNDDFESAHFPNISSQSASSDPDGDGYNNAHELAFAGDPNVADSSKLGADFTQAPANSNFTLSYRRPTNYLNYGLSYRLMTSTTLSTDWTEITNITPNVTPNGDSSETVTYDIPSSGNTKFYKVEVP